MKLFEFIAGVILIWFVLRTVRQAQHQNSRSAKPMGSMRKPAAPTRSQAMQSATDTVACPRCGVYVPTDHRTACDRADCPFPKAG